MPLVYTIVALLVCMFSCLLHSMDGIPEKRYYTYDQDGCHYVVESALLKPAKPTAKTAKPALLYEYFGLSERFGERATGDIKQKIIQILLHRGLPWQQKTTVPYAQATVLAYSKSGDQLVLGGQDAVCVSDRAGRIVKTIRLSGKTNAAVFHPADQSLIVCSSTAFHKIDAHGDVEKSVDAGLWPVKCLVNAHTNELIALDDSGVLKIWPLAGGAPFKKDTRLQTMLDLACHYAGDIFALVRCSYVLLFQRSTDELKALPHDKGTAGILALAFEPRGDTLVTASFNGLLTFWQPHTPEKSVDVTNWKVARVLDVAKRCKLKHPAIGGVAFHPRGHILVSLHNLGNRVIVWDLLGNMIASMPACSTTPDVPRYKIMLAMHPNDNELAIGYPYMPIALWQKAEFPSLEQLLFKLILAQYLKRCIAAQKKPGYPLSMSSDTFIDWMSDWFFLEKKGLLKVWNTFSSARQIAVIKTYIEHAKKVGDIEERLALWQQRKVHNN